MFLNEAWSRLTGHLTAKFSLMFITCQGTLTLTHSCTKAIRRHQMCDLNCLWSAWSRQCCCTSRASLIPYVQQCRCNTAQHRPACFGKADKCCRCCLLDSCMSVCMRAMGAGVAKETAMSNSIWSIFDPMSEYRGVKVRHQASLAVLHALQVIGNQCSVSLQILVPSLIEGACTAYPLSLRHAPASQSRPL